MACAQYLQLQEEYPNTLRLVMKHFLPDLAAAVTNDRGHNPAGYLLYQLRRAGRHAVEVHGPERATLKLCDSIFAAEVQWHHDKKTVIRNLIPFFGTVWFNLVHERGERWQQRSSPPATASGAPALRVLNSPVTIGEALKDAVSRRKSASA